MTRSSFSREFKIEAVRLVTAQGMREGKRYRYTYLGDRWTQFYASDLAGARCDPVRRADGKCIVSTRFATALVRFENGEVHVVPRRRLRLTGAR